jgi:hypothetical protein
MRRTLLVVLAAVLVLAPAAMAKGPHVIVTTPREAVEAGRPWEFTAELNEFRHPPRPAVSGTNGGQRVIAHVERTPSSITGAAAFRVTMVFPREGRWRVRMIAGKRRFAIPAVGVGSGTMPQDWVAFPLGSGTPSGGPFTTDEAPAEPTTAEPTTGGTLPPERHDTAAPNQRDDGRGPGAWILPLAGVVLAGAGVAAVSRRRSR